MHLKTQQSYTLLHSHKILIVIVLKTMHVRRRERTSSWVQFQQCPLTVKLKLAPPLRPLTDIGETRP